MKIIPYLIIVLLLCVIFRNSERETLSTERYMDTVIVRDTVRDTVTIPRTVYLTRVDTVKLQSASDTVFVDVTVSVERKEYRTDDYHAVIEGYRANLVSMSVFPETTFITEHITTSRKKNPRFGVGIQAGYGYSSRGPSPYIGVGIQYNLLTF